jgi:hypothetical protein
MQTDLVLDELLPRCDCAVGVPARPRSSSGRSRARNSESTVAVHAGGLSQWQRQFVLPPPYSPRSQLRNRILRIGPDVIRLVVERNDHAVGLRQNGPANNAATSTQLTRSSRTTTVPRNRRCIEPDTSDHDDWTWQPGTLPHAISAARQGGLDLCGKRFRHSGKPKDTVRELTRGGSFGVGNPCRDEINHLASARTS